MATAESPLQQLAAALSTIENSDEASALQKSVEALVQLTPKLSATCTDDISTTALELLSASYHLGRAYLKLPTLTDQGPDSATRKKNVLAANEYFDKYLRMCEEIDLLNDVVVKEYHLLLNLLDSEDGNGSNSGGRKLQLAAGQIREIKIGRYQRKKSIEANVAKLEGLQERRVRLGIEEEEEMEGTDGEGLRRDLSLER
jgi:hypothetical protein